jgi:prophage DNA circulation protein
MARDWRNEQRGQMASFRGVKFHTQNADAQVGRRNVMHEYPQRDVPFSEDLGRKARQFVVDGYVVGETYLDERDALITAIEGYGPGELVHPRYGVLQVVVVGSVSIKESHDQGGIARFSITFAESGENEFPQAKTNTVSEVDAAASLLDEVTQSDFAKNFKAVQNSISSTLTKIQTGLNKALAVARGLSDTSSLAGLVRQVSGISVSLTSLIHTPANLAAQLSTLQNSLVLSVRRPVAALADLKALTASHERESPSGTVRPGSTRALALADAQAVADVNRRLLLSTQARVLVLAVQPGVVATAVQALDLRDALLAQLDAELEATDPAPEVAAALVGLRAAVVRDVSVRAQRLHETSTYTPTAVLPAVVLAHRIYGDASRTDELVSRNSVANPAFVPVRALEVLI